MEQLDTVACRRYAGMTMYSSVPGAVLVLLMIHHSTCMHAVTWHHALPILLYIASNYTQFNNCTANAMNVVFNISWYTLESL